MSTNIEVLREMDELVEAARLLGATQAKKLFGCYTDEDRRFERAMYESIDKHRAALLDWEAKQPAPQQPAAGVGCHCGTCTCNPNMTPAVRFDLSPAQQEGAIREHLIRLGWTPPDEHAVSKPAEQRAEIEALRAELDGTIRKLLAERDQLAAALAEAQHGLRYAVRVWVLSDEIMWSEKEIDEAVERIIGDAKKETRND